MTRTIPFLPLEITQEEARAGFRIMVLDLNSYFGVGDGVEVVARKLSDTDVLIKMRGTSSSRGLHDFYELIRFGFEARLLRIRWPWTEIGWHALKPWLYHTPDADFSVSLATPDTVGVPFHEGSV